MGGALAGRVDAKLLIKEVPVPGDTSLVNLGELSEPATVLIEKISDAIGGIFRPYQIRRVAAAESEAEKIRAVARIEITELERWSMARHFAEEANKQVNMVSITQKAFGHLEPDARPEDVENDWIVNFFDKCRLISDEQMQALWAKVLAGEANSPGHYSKRTVNFLSSLDKSDAELFRQLCGFGWYIGDVVPVVFDVTGAIYMNQGINFSTLKHLDEIGLVSLESLGGYRRTRLPEVITIHYYGTPVNVRFGSKENNDLDLGNVLLSKVGQELAPISGSEPVPGFMDYALSQWGQRGLVLYSNWPRS